MTEEEKKYSKREFELGQLAAYIDGEGTITIKRRAACIEKKSKKRKRESFGLEISMVNTDLRLINWACEKFGGSFNGKKARNSKHKNSAVWLVHGQIAFKLLESMRPFLIIKGEQADVGMEFWKKCSMITTKIDRGKRRLGWMILRQNEYYKKMKNLNKNGPDK